MYGLEAINANNGWAISIVGISIVFSGLVSLSMVISQLHKALALWEDPGKIKAFFKVKKSKQVQEKVISDIVVFTENKKEIARQFALLVRTMEDHFSLPRLLQLAQISGLQEPHSNLNDLLKTKIIIPDGSGFFTWDKEMFGAILSK